MHVQKRFGNNSPSNFLSLTRRLDASSLHVPAADWASSNGLPTKFSSTKQGRSACEKNIMILSWVGNHQWQRALDKLVSQSLSAVEHRPFSLMLTGCVASLRWDWAIFCHAGWERVGRVWSTGEKSVEILRHGRVLNQGHREHRQWNTFILSLSWQVITS